MTYTGYALPRLITITKSTWLSVVIVSIFYSLQHCFLSIADFRYGFYTFLLFLPLAIALELIYLRIKRLPPLIIGHWLMDLASVLFLLQLR
jgi:membrane protease YdiL (CAAX protease family)